MTQRCALRARQPNRRGSMGARRSPCQQRQPTLHTWHRHDERTAPRVPATRALCSPKNADQRSETAVAGLVPRWGGDALAALAALVSSYWVRPTCTDTRTPSLLPIVRMMHCPAAANDRVPMAPTRHRGSAPTHTHSRRVGRRCTARRRAAKRLPGQAGRAGHPSEQGVTCSWAAARRGGPSRRPFPALAGQIS